MLESCGPLMSPWLLQGTFVLPFPWAQRGSSCRRPFPHHTDPPLLCVQYQWCFLDFISGQQSSSSLALGNVFLLPFLAVSSIFFFYLSAPSMHKPSQCDLRNLSTSVCLARSSGLHGGCCCSCINPASHITDRAYSVNYFSKRLDFSASELNQS